MPSIRVRAQPKRCLSWLMRPSQPVRHFTSRRKAPPPLDRLAGEAGSAFAGNGDPGHAKVGHVPLDGGLAVATVGGDRPGRLAGAGDDPRDCGGQQRRVRRVADHDGVVYDDPLGVVDDLCLTCGAPAGQLGDLYVLPGSSSAAHATARSRSQRRPIGPSRRDRRDRSAVEAAAADEGLAQPGVGRSQGHLTWPPPPDRACRRGPHGMRPRQSCEAVQQTVKCPAGRQAHWWSWPQIIRSTGEKARRAHRQTAGTGSQAWSPRARRVWWTRRASLRATEITPRWPSARRLTARK